MSDTTVRVVPTADPANAPKNNPSQAVENVRQVKLTAVSVTSGPGTLYGCIFANTGVVAQFAHVYDTDVAPTNASIPAVCVSLPASGTASMDFGAYGLAFNKGCWVGNSTTAAVRTAGAADTLFYPRFL